MSDVDISGLGLQPLSPEDRVEYGKGYEAGGEYQVPPPEGGYLVQTIGAKLKAHKGFLAFDFTGQIAANAKGEKVGEGYKVYQSSISIKKYKNRNGSPAGDYLAAHGIVFTNEPNEQDYANAITATVGRTAPFSGQWEGFCKDCEETLEGSAQFPVAADGTKLHKRPCPQCKKDVFARLRVNRWVSTVPTQAEASRPLAAAVS